MRLRLITLLLTLTLSIGVFSVRAQATVAPLPYEYALMSQLAYNPASSLLSDLTTRHWEEFAASDQRGLNDELGYFGIAYINHETQQVVIAHRGTDQKGVTQLFNRSIDIDDNLHILQGKTPAQFQNSALRFISRVYARLHDDGLLDYAVSHTGHSLGAALAEMSALTEPFTSAITFDSPGVALRPPPGEPFITSYLAAPNFINTVNRHPGRVILLDGDWQNLRAKHFPRLFVALVSPHSFLSSYVRYSLDAHSMDRILTTLDPTSGQPLRGIDVFGWWPLGVFASFRNYLMPKETPSLVFSSQGIDALEHFLSRLKTIQTDAEFQDLIDEYVVLSRRLTDNLSDLYTLVIMLTCQDAACIAHSSRECFIGDTSLSYACVREFAA
jgi:hypothetical protein